MWTTEVGVRQLWAVVVREWWVTTRAYRLSFFASALMGALFTLFAGRVLYESVFAGATTPAFAAAAGTHDYLTYLTLGVIANAFTFRLLYPVRNVLEEHREGTLPALVMSGMRSGTFQAGCVGFSAAYALVEVAVILAAALPWSGASLGLARPGALLVILLASAVSLGGLSLLLSAIVLAVGDRLVVESIAFSLMALVGGVAFPTAYLPRALQLLAEALPLTWILRALREQVMNGGGIAALAPSLGALLLLGVLHAAFGTLVMRRVLRRSLEVSA